MTEADRWRICPHPSLVPHPLPRKIPVIRDRSRIVAVPSGFMFKRPELMRCTMCGQVGELATPNV